MSLLPILLFILGLICLIWAMKMGNSSGKSSPEILTILQGLAGVKKEVSQVQKGLREVKAQLGDHELRLISNENVQADLRSEVNAQKISLSQLTSSNMNTCVQNQTKYNNTYTYPNHLANNFFDTAINTSTKNLNPSPHPNPPQVLPEKYQWVLELYNQGWSEAEIAGHLAISRDAVNMVLRTAPQGKGLEL